MRIAEERRVSPHQVIRKQEEQKVKEEWVKNKTGDLFKDIIILYYC